MCPGAVFIPSLGLSSSSIKQDSCNWWSLRIILTLRFWFLNLPELCWFIIVLSLQRLWAKEALGYVFLTLVGPFLLQQEVVLQQRWSWVGKYSDYFIKVFWVHLVGLVRRWNDSITCLFRQNVIISADAFSLTVEKDLKITSHFL